MKIRYRQVTTCGLITGRAGIAGSQTRRLRIEVEHWIGRPAAGATNHCHTSDARLWSPALFLGGWEDEHASGAVYAQWTAARVDAAFLCLDSHHQNAIAATPGAPVEKAGMRGYGREPYALDVWRAGFVVRLAEQ